MVYFSATGHAKLSVTYRHESFMKCPHESSDGNHVNLWVEYEQAEQYRQHGSILICQVGLVLP